MEGKRVDISKSYETEDRKTCMYCKSTQLERIPRPKAVKIFLGWLPLKRYICYNCVSKQYRFS